MCADGWPDCYPLGPDAFYEHFGAFHTMHKDPNLSRRDIASMSREEAEMRQGWAEGEDQNHE